MNSFGPLYAMSSTNKIKTWRAEVTTDEDGASYLWTYHGYIDGVESSNMKAIKGKNIGRSNETTPHVQACLEAQSKMQKKMDEGYVENQADLATQELILPMLAHPYSKRKHNIKWPAFVQPKLNGVRCTTDNTPTYFSRNGKVYDTLEHLDNDVLLILDLLGSSVRLDGEIFNQEFNFQETVRAIKKFREDISINLQYWIFDYIDLELTFDERYAKLKDAFIQAKALRFGDTYKYNNLVLVPSYLANNEEEMLSWHKRFTGSGFEGTIIRNCTGKYKLTHRSADLQKHKDFLDAEFKIVDGAEATGDDAGTVVFICETSNGKRFSVRPKGSRSIRREWFENLANIIGSELTVRYQELSEDGIPIFPVGLAIRDYE